MDNRLIRAGLAGLIFTAAAVAMGYAISGRLPTADRAPALLAPALLTTGLFAASDRRTARRLGYGVLAVPVGVVVALLVLATIDQIAGVWTGMALGSMIYQAAALASAGLGITYGWRYRVCGGHVLAAIGLCWLTAFAAVGWTMALPNAPALAQHIGRATLALAAAGLAGWIVGYGLRERQSAPADLPDNFDWRSAPRGDA